MYPARITKLLVRMAFLVRVFQNFKEGVMAPINKLVEQRD